MKKLIFSSILTLISFCLHAQYWLLAGNPSTTPSSQFIGTTDANPLVFKTNNSESFRILTNGRIVIGDNTYTTFPASGDYRMAVKDGIITERLKIKLRASWPDYVFSGEYSLLPLTDVEKYLKQNNHLPGIQSAADVKENGIEVGEMNAKLLQKIEELTLYMIKADQQIRELQEVVKQIKQKN